MQLGIRHLYGYHGIYNQRLSINSPYVYIAYNADITPIRGLRPRITDLRIPRLMLYSACGYFHYIYGGIGIVRADRSFSVFTGRYPRSAEGLFLVSFRAFFECQ